MAPSGQMTAPALQTLLRDATLAGNWTLNPSKSTIGLRSRSMWGLAPVKGVFREVTGTGAAFPARVSVCGSDEVLLDSEVKVNRADFGLTWNQMGIASMNNTITVHAVFGRH